MKIVDVHSLPRRRALTLLCIVPWVTCVYDYPVNHPRITAKEISYIDRNRRQSTSSKKKDSIGIYPLHSSDNGMKTEVTVLMKPGVHNGMLSSLPFIGRFFGSIVSGILSDFLLVRGYLSITNLRKVFQVFGCIMSAPCLVVVSFLDSDSRVLAVILIVLYWTIHSTTNSAFRVNPLDIAPREKGSLLSFIRVLKITYKKLSEAKCLMNEERKKSTKTYLNTLNAAGQDIRRC
ncbi:hypothetical protein KUTeg_001846 [Tegillarca granosa]|uniref:Uncharacterized protein n=1 Tax=Tegillarca granosa TaxID=220873 RepID=A0ABQ9FSL8_TEGGR|nr:hypothetical protein KUTeg_001846 [Tegillarca granosa]